MKKVVIIFAVLAAGIVAYNIYENTKPQKKALGAKGQRQNGDLTGNNPLSIPAGNSGVAVQLDPSKFGNIQGLLSGIFGNTNQNGTTETAPSQSTETTTD